MVLGFKKIQGEIQTSYPSLSKEEKDIAQKLLDRYVRKFNSDEVKQNNKQELIQNIQTELQELSEVEYFYLDSDQQTRIIESVYQSVHGLGPFDDILSNENIEEIAVIGPDKPVFVYLKNRGWVTCDFAITSEDEIIDIVNKMVKGQARRLTFKTPKINAVLEDKSRLHASCSPISQGEITIRRFMQNRLSLSKICKNKTADFEKMALLSLAINVDSSILICGNTASGKTTTLNALLSFLDPNERVIITEETPEIFLHSKHFVRMISNPENNISLQDIIYDTLRMRPDKIIVGEIRTPEEFNAFVQTLITGQGKGSFATMHAVSSKEAVEKFHILGIPVSDLSPLDIILVQKRSTKFDKKSLKFIEYRKVEEIKLFEASSDSKFLLYDLDASVPDKHANLRFYKKLMAAYSVDIKGLRKLISQRARFLQSLSEKDMSFEQETEEIWGELFAI